MKNAGNKNWIKRIVPVIPLAGVVGASFLPIRFLSRQLLMLITLVWIQVFFILECFLVGK